jgi:hypothetical protein
LHRIENPPSSREIHVGPGVSPLQVVLTALRDLQDEHGAVVEEVDVGPNGGSFVLKVPLPGDESDEVDPRRSHPTGADT